MMHLKPLECQENALHTLEPGLPWTINLLSIIFRS